MQNSKPTKRNLSTTILGNIIKVDDPVTLKLTQLNGIAIRIAAEDLPPCSGMAHAIDTTGLPKAA